MRGILRGVVVAAACVLLVERSAQGFVLAEHSRITEDALRALAENPTTQQVVSELIVLPGLCAQPTKDAPDEASAWRIKPSDCVQLVADVVAIAGDHSCTPTQLGTMLAEANGEHGKDHFFWKIRDIARDTDVALNGAGDNERRKYVISVMQNGYAAAMSAAKHSHLVDPEAKGAGNVVVARDLLRRQLNLSLQIADEDYLRRAKTDGGHFQLARQSGPITLADYLAQSFRPGQIGNATAFYANYHIAAMRIAERASHFQGAPGTPARATRDALRQRAFLVESFALHFLEDSFSAGHIVGHWEEKGWPLRSEGVRIGTHDHYSNEGIEAFRWVDLDPNGAGVTRSYRARGDGFMSADDRRFAALGATTSLEQVIRAMAGGIAPGFLDQTAKVPAFEDYDSCHEEHVPAGLDALLNGGTNPLLPVYATEPVAAPADPPLLRFRSEAGLFLGGAISLDGGSNFLHLDDARRASVGRARATVRGGFGLAGLSSDPFNTLLFVDAGVVALGTNVTNPSSDVGLTFRLRAPGMVTLADGLIVMIAAAASENPKLLKTAIRAQRGGLGQFWAAHNVVRHFYFQWSILRDVSFSYFPHSEERKFRWEMMFPLATGRVAIPIAGDALAQSNDYWFDFGASFGRSKDVGFTSTWDFGVFLSASTSSRTFP